MDALLDSGIAGGEHPAAAVDPFHQPLPFSASDPVRWIEQDDCGRSISRKQAVILEPEPGVLSSNHVFSHVFQEVCEGLGVVGAGQVGGVAEVHGIVGQRGGPAHDGGDHQSGAEAGKQKQPLSAQLQRPVDRRVHRIRGSRPAGT